MASTSTYSWIQTAHYNIAYLATLLLILSLSTTSRAASIGSSVKPTNCVCTTQGPNNDITGSTPVGVKEIPAGVSIDLLPPTTVPNKLTFKLSKRIKMADQQVKGDGAQEVVIGKEVAPKEVDKAVDLGKQRKNHEDKPQDNIMFPKDDEPVTPTNEVSKTTMSVGNRILIGGSPNDGYGRDANGEIVEVFQ